MRNGSKRQTKLVNGDYVFLQETGMFAITCYNLGHCEVDYLYSRR